MKEIDFVAGKYGLCAVLRSAWSDDIAKEIQDCQCPELEINYAKGWRGNDLKFLYSCPWLKSLKVIDLTIKSVEPIHILHKLQALEVITYCNTPLRFSAFPHLEDCALEWRPRSESLFACQGLKHLFVNRYTGANLTSFASLEKLESLAVLNAPIVTLDGISSLVGLRVLRLANLKKLQSLAGIQYLVNLEELEVHTCMRIHSINEVAALSKLRKLHLNNDGKIDSLKPLDKISGLESVVFYESTNIEDGDLSPLTRQKNLVNVSFQNRRHYTHKRENFSIITSM